MWLEDLLEDLQSILMPMLCAHAQTSELIQCSFSASTRWQCVSRLAQRNSLSFPKAAAVMQADTFAIGVAALSIYWIYIHLIAIACSSHHWAWPASTPARLRAGRPSMKHIIRLLHQEQPACE